jgi:hypothetical protein
MSAALMHQAFQSSGTLASTLAEHAFVPSLDNAGLGEGIMPMHRAFLSGHYTRHVAARAETARKMPESVNWIRFQNDET